MKFTQLAKSLQEKTEPVYLIEGEEAYFREHAVKSIREALHLTQPLLNDVCVEGETLKGDRLSSFRDDLFQLPFFDESRLVRVTEFYPTEREWESVMQGYCDRPSPTTVLVIVNAGKKGAADLKKKRGVTYVDCARMDEEPLARWLYALMKREGLDPSADAAELMVKYCNCDAARMKKETEKLKLLVGEGGKITRAVVDDCIAKDAEYKIYELTQAASRGNFTAFSEILSDLMDKGYDENAALASLTSHYKTLSEIAGMSGTDAEIGAALSIKPYAVQKNRELIGRLGRARVRELYLALYGLGCGMRSGELGKSGALYAAIAEIFFG